MVAADSQKTFLGNLVNCLQEHPSEEGMYLHAVTIAMAMGMEAAFLERWTPAGMSESVRELLQQAAAESLAEWKANAI